MVLPTSGFYNFLKLHPFNRGQRTNFNYISLRTNKEGHFQCSLASYISSLVLNKMVPQKCPFPTPWTLQMLLYTLHNKRDFVDVNILEILRRGSYPRLSCWADII